MVERWFHPGGGEGFKALLDDHRSILMEMRRVLERDGDDGVRGMVSADRTEYRDSLVKLVRESRHDPKVITTNHPWRGRRPFPCGRPWPYGRMCPSTLPHARQELLGRITFEDGSGDPGDSIPARSSHDQPPHLLCGRLSELPLDQLNQHCHLPLLDSLLTPLLDSLLTPLLTPLLDPLLTTLRDSLLTTLRNSLLPDLVQAALELGHHGAHRHRLLQLLVGKSLRT